MDSRTAVVLLNLGGPDSLAAVQPFLYNLFSDPDIFEFPLGRIGQKMMASLIARRRAPTARKNYAAIGGRSPILENTNAQAQALQAALAPHGDYTVFVCMRYWEPRSDEVVDQLKQQDYRRVILLPLYPQYSKTTTGSSYNDFRRSCQNQGYAPEVRLIESWYDADGYIAAIADSIRAAAKDLPDPEPARIELLFSAHGLPKKLITAGDPYADQIKTTYAAVNSQLRWPRTQLCYQSRVGPLEWLKPYTDKVIEELGEAGAKQVLVYPIAFVSDHVETLYELGIEYAELARRYGIDHYRVVPALNDDPQLIQTLKDLVLQEADHD